jgi:hypothetical protein
MLWTKATNCRSPRFRVDDALDKQKASTLSRPERKAVGGILRIDDELFLTRTLEDLFDRNAVEPSGMVAIEIAILLRKNLAAEHRVRLKEFAVCLDFGYCTIPTCDWSAQQHTE